MRSGERLRGAFGRGGIGFDRKASDLHRLSAEAVVDDLVDGMERFEIFRMPQRSPGDRIKYDYVMRYDDPSLLIHVKMTPIEGASPFVFLGFHSHNIPGPPLPQIPIHSDDEEE